MNLEDTNLLEARAPVELFLRHPRVGVPDERLGGDPGTRLLLSAWLARQLLAAPR